MKNILNIFKTDINNIRKKRAAIVVIVALMILPSMYAWFNILPSWDPYANTEDVAVAVVNNDEGATVEGEPLNVGDEVILSLLDNKSMGWQFVDEEEARDGVENGDYYASIIIPKDFSRKLSSVLDDEPEKPELDYYINEKINAIAPKVTNAGASGIVESIHSGFVKVANEAIFTAFNDIGIELETNRASLERLRDSIYDLEDNLPEIERLLSTADTDLDKVEESVGKANDGVKKAEDISKDAERMSERLEDMLVESDKTVREYVPLVKQDLRIAQTVIQEVPSITRRISQKGADVDQLLNTITDSTEKIDDSRKALQSLADLLESADERLTDDRDFEALINRMNEEYERVDELRQKLEKVTRALATGDHIGTDIVTDINNMAREMEEELHRVIALYEETVIPEIEKAIDKVEDLIQFSVRKIEKVQKGNKALLIVLKAYNIKNKIEQSEFLGTAKEILGNLHEPIDPLMPIIEDANQRDEENSFETTNKKLKPIYDLMNEADEIVLEIEELEDEEVGSDEGEDDAVEDGEIKDKVKEKLKAKLFQRLEEKLVTIDKELEKLLTNDLPKIEEEFANATAKLQDIEKDLTEKLNRLKRAAEVASDITDGLVGIVKDPKETLKVLRSAIDRIEEGQDVISSIIKTSERVQKIFDDGLFLDGVDRIEGLQTDLQTFKGDILRIVDGGRNAKREAGKTLNKLEDKSRELDRAISDMLRFIDRDLMPKYEDASGKASNAIKEGNKILLKASAYFPNIYDLLEQVDEGVGKGKDGLDKANDAFPDAKEKVTDIANRVRILEEKGDLDQIIRLLKNDPSIESEFFSDPLVLNEHSLFPIPNYGSAMAPFFTALALWVGGLILASSLIVDVPNKERYKSYETYFGRILTFWAIGIVQALIVTVGNMVLLKTFVAHKVWFVLFGFFVSIVFMTIIYTLVSVFGNTGKVISIILLVMQLGASGGTFPIQMTPMFFQKIHNFLPFTHALGLFRESIGGIIWPAVMTHLAWLIGYMLLFLFIGIKLKERINKSSDKFLKEARESEIIL